MEARSGACRTDWHDVLSRLNLLNGSPLRIRMRLRLPRETVLLRRA